MNRTGPTSRKMSMRIALDYSMMFPVLKNGDLDLSGKVTYLFIFSH